MIDSSILQGKKAAYFTLGCKLNFAETSTVAQQLARYGVRKVQKGEVADIVVVNTCSVTEVADHKCRQAIHRLVKQHPGAFVVVTGCYAQLKPQEIVETEGVDLVLGSEQKGNIIPMIMETLSLTLPRNGEGTHPVSSSTAKNPKGLPPHYGGGSGRGSVILLTILLIILNQLWHNLFDGAVDDVVGNLVDRCLWVVVDGDDDT